MGVLQQPYTTLGTLERLGIQTKAIQALSLLTRRDAIKGASGLLEAPLRTRHMPRFLVEHDPDFDDLSGMTGGAAPVWSLAPAGPVMTCRPMDVALTFPVGGVVGAQGITYTLNIEAGARGSAPSAAKPFPLEGVLLVGGYPFQLPVGAVVNAGDSLLFSLRTDAGLMTATALLAAATLLNARGVDPDTQETLDKSRADAWAWVRSIATGDGDLDKAADATPQKQEGGFRFKHGREQKSAYGWVDDGGHDR